MKKRLVSLAVIISCLAVLSTGTYAYFTTEETTHNIITTGNVQIAIRETMLDPTNKNNEIPYIDAENILPGDSISKIVRIENIGKSDAWVRVKVEKDITLAAGQTGNANIGLIEVDFNTADWTEKDGYYYYNHKLDAGEKTSALFEEVVFSKSMDNIYQNCTINVDVKAQGTQVDNNGTKAIDAKGWPNN